MTSGFEVGASATFEALHRIPWVEGPERELHSHAYRVEVVVERSRLDERGMVCDLDVLDAALGEAVAAIAGKNLDETIARPEAEAVTVEMLAEWFHGRLRDAVGGAGGEAAAVRVWESPTAFGGYRAPLG